MLHTVTNGLEHSDPGRARVLPDTVKRLVHDIAARARADAVGTFGEARGTKDAAEGLADTLEALRRGAVGQLFVVESVSDDRRAWVWSDPLRLAAVNGPNSDSLAEDGAEQARLTDAMARAAFAQGADVTVVGEDEAALTDGVGALIRF
jgi:hypothetical protein